MPKFVDITGQEFGRLTVIERAPNKGSHTMWLCQCHCGKRKIINGGNLKSKHTTSCGCFQIECVTRHGLNNSDEYRAWENMKQRCYGEYSNRYHRYGGRGIKICDRWLNSFENFHQDMGPRPSTKHSLDRWPNNNGDYEPNNCRWATTKEQNRNTERNKYITFNNHTLTLVEWSEMLGIKSITLLARLRRGWPVKRALTTPVR